MTEKKQSKSIQERKLEEELKLLFKEFEIKDMSNYQIEQNSIKIAQEKYRGKVKKNIEKNKINEIDAVSYFKNEILKEFTLTLMKNLNHEYCSNRTKNRPFYNIIKMLKDFSKLNRNFIQNHNKENPENKIFLHKDLINMDFARLAEITIANIIQSAFATESINSCAKKIGTSLNDELIFDCFRTKYPEILKSKLDEYKYNSNQNLRTSMVFLANKIDDFDLEQIDSSSRSLIGKVLVDIFLKNNSNIAFNREYRKKKNAHRKKSRSYMTVSELNLTDEFKNETDRLIGIRLLASTEYKPMTIKPKPWTSVWDGGYYSLSHLTFIKANKKIIRRMSQYDLSYTMQQVNRIQEVPYRINHQVYDVMQNLFINSIGDIKNKFGDDVLPVEIKDEAKPQRPPILDANLEEMSDENKEIYKKEKNDYKKKMHAFYYEKASTESKRNLMRNILSLAAEYKNKVMYFPHQVDKRGRIYAVPKFLNPQSNDYSKGMLLLANKEKITADGVESLKFHIANVFAFDNIDKQSFEDKVKWTEENEEMILNIANNPYDYTEWHNADKCWQALAACFEYKGWKEQGFDFETSLIVDVDGANNALQHYGALLLDRKTAEMCNIADNFKPKDSYLAVADATREMMLENFALKYNDEEKALVEKILAFGFGRKECKHPVMTLGYGSTPNGWRSQIMKVYNKKIAAGTENVFNDIYERHNAVSLIINLLKIIMPEKIAAAFVAMETMKDYMRIALDDGKEEFIWVNPIGFPLYQKYKKTDSKTVTMNFNRKQIEMPKYRETEKNDVGKLINACAPNFIHSIDSCNLLMTVDEMHKKGIKDYVFVHDSFGCGANNLKTMRIVVRNTFADLHHDNLFKGYILSILDGVEHDISMEKIDEDTKRGDFNLDEVRVSKYSFN